MGNRPEDNKDRSRRSRPETQGPPKPPDSDTTTSRTPVCPRPQRILSFRRFMSFSAMFFCTRSHSVACTERNERNRKYGPSAQPAHSTEGKRRPHGPGMLSLIRMGLSYCPASLPRIVPPALTPPYPSSVVLQELPLGLHCIASAYTYDHTPCERSWLGAEYAGRESRAPKPKTGYERCCGLIKLSSVCSFWNAYMSYGASTYR